MSNKIKKGRPKTFNIEQANKIAMETYWVEGMANVSLNRMCRNIGESKPSVYREYGGEAGLQFAALELYYKEKVEILKDYLLKEGNFIKNIELTFDYLINKHYKNQTGSSCMFNKESLFPAKNLAQECKKFIIKKDKEAISTLTLAMKKAIDSGELNINVNLEVYSAYILNQIKLISALSNNKLPKSVLIGMVNLILEPLKNN